MRIEDIARTCYEANRAVQHALGESDRSESWDEASDEARLSTIDGVRNAQRGATAEQSHDNWLAFKRSHGWKLGPIKDEVARTHPLIVEYRELPAEQRTKDDLFIAVVRALS